MSKQVLSIEQMHNLQELGVDTSKTNFYWHRTKSLNNYQEWDEWKLHYGVLKLARGFKAINCEYVRTFTLQDILDLLPSEIKENSECNILSIDKFSDYWYVRYELSDEFEPLISFEFKELIDASYEMLCWCIENGHVKTNNED